MSSPSKSASAASPSPKKPPSSSSASSIGKNSSDDDDNATAASDQGGDQLSLNVNALEDALPIKYVSFSLFPIFISFIYGVENWNLKPFSALLHNSCMRWSCGAVFLIVAVEVITENY